MKKIIPALVFLSLLAVIFSPILVEAQEKVPNCCKLSRTITLGEGAASTTYEGGKTVGSEETCNLTGSAPDYTTKEWGLLCLLSSVYVITDWIFTFLMAVVGVMIILGAFTIVTAAGSPEKLNKGKSYILYAAIGMVVALLAKAVPALIKSLLG
jgi:hypothetical protein